MRLAIAIAFSVLSFLAPAEERFLVGVQDIRYFPHYDFRSEDKGALWAILEAFSQHTGYRFEYVAYPIKRLNREIMDGKLDFVFPENPKWYNQQVPENIKTYSKPLYKALGGSFALRQDTPLVAKDVRRLVIPRGFSPVMWRDQIEQGRTTLIEVTDSHAALNLLLKGRANVADLEYAVVLHLKNSNPAYENIEFVTTLPYDVVSFHIATIAHPELLNAFDAFISENRTTVDSLLEQYGINKAVWPEAIK